jgi:hypothetical protein
MSKITKIKREDADYSYLNGTSLKGYLNGVTYDDLFQTFGPSTYLPIDSGDGKVNYEWVFKYKGEYYTVYDWKVPEQYVREYYGKEGELEFHVGGKGFAGDFIDALEKEIKKIFV